MREELAPLVKKCRSCCCARAVVAAASKQGCQSPGHRWHAYDFVRLERPRFYKLDQRRVLRKRHDLLAKIAFAKFDVADAPSWGV